MFFWNITVTWIPSGYLTYYDKLDIFGFLLKHLSPLCLQHIATVMTAVVSSHITVVCICLKMSQIFILYLPLIANSI